MNSFEYYNPTKMIFGENAVDKLKDLLEIENLKDMKYLVIFKYIL